MKRNRHIGELWAGLLAFALTFTACTLHEEPELTADGEPGVDPTLVDVELTLNLDLNLPEQADETQTSVKVGANADYLHRFIVEAYLNRQPVAREVIVENITDRTRLSLPVSMKLHARPYQIVVWKDYVDAETPEEDLHWNTQSLVPVIPNRASHTGNTEYKDVFVGTTSLDLSAYTDQWGAVIEQDVALQRPMARYELRATDVDKFLQRIADGEVSGDRFTARIKYSGYLSAGYNVLDDVPKHSLMYMQYETDFEVPEAGTADVRLGFDYVFVSTEGSATVPMEIEIVDADNVTVANSVLNVSLERGKNTVWTGEFLTGDDQGGQGGGDNPDEEDGIGIDSDYDNEINWGVTVE